MNWHNLFSQILQIAVEVIDVRPKCPRCGGILDKSKDFENWLVCKACGSVFKPTSYEVK